VRSHQGDETVVTLEPVRGKPGSYEGRMRPPREGNYEVTSAELESGEDTAMQSFRVIASQTESEGPMDQGELMDLAEAADGRFVPPDQLLRAADAIPSREARQVIRIPHAVWDSWVSLMLFLALLCTEWILRKRANLL
jgi:hypothetical protein